MSVVPATSPKKQSLMPSDELRRKLRGIGHNLEAVLQIGKEGVKPSVLKQMNGALFDHELIKVKIGTECPQDRFEVAALLAAEPGVNIVQILGRVILVYKRHPETPKFEGPRSRPPVVKPPKKSHKR